MPSTPFDAAHQKSLRALIGKVLPDARAQHIAEAVAAGYGYRTHKTFLGVVQNPPFLGYTRRAETAGLRGSDFYLKSVRCGRRLASPGQARWG